MATPSKPPHQSSPPTPQQPSHPTSPPARHKDNLKSWWRKFTKDSEQDSRAAAKAPGIFGVPLRQSITYANVAISLVDDDGKSYIYGYVPIVVAKCGVFLKEKATSVEGIFRLSGSEKRIKELKAHFDSPDRYGKGLVWDGFTVHDAANVLRRYLNDLPEPVVPLDLYEQFRDPLRGHTKQAVGDSEGTTQPMDSFNETEAIQRYQQLIKELPPLNRQLLLYILDLLAVFAAKAEENRMTAENLAAIFQPGMLSHPTHAMAPEEYRLNQCVIIFLINKQDNFLIGMQGTGTDEKTKQEIEKGAPAIVTPTTPARKSGGVHRSASNSSAAADSISRDGMLRRNRSVSSRHSRQSNGATTPNSPAHTATPSSGLGRSNTVPSKKSPHVPSGRFQARQESPSTVAAPSSPSPAGGAVATPPTVSEEPQAVNEPIVEARKTSQTGPSTLMPGAYIPARNQDRTLEANNDMTAPFKDKGLQAIFNRSPADNSKRQPNKLQKKRVTSSNNPSAHSSTVSLAPHLPAGAPSPALDLGVPAEEEVPAESSHQPENATTIETPSEPTPRASQVPSMTTVQQAHESNNSLKPKPSSPTSLHSSLNDASDPDPSHDESTQPSTNEQAQSDKEKKKFFRLSRRKDDLTSPTFPLFGTSNNNNSELSASSSGSAQKPRKSWTGESTDIPAGLVDGEPATKDKDDGKGPMKWIKNKMREAKENAEHKRAKSPPADNSHTSLPLELKRTNDERPAPPSNLQSPVEPKNPPIPQDIPLPMSPPATQTTHSNLGAS